MTHVATLIAHPNGLSEDALIRARAVLPRAGDPQWLDRGIAADIAFTPDEGNDQRAVTGELREILSGQSIDIVVQPVAHRRKMLLVADMDSTMIGQECIDELADL